MNRKTIGGISLLGWILVVTGAVFPASGEDLSLLPVFDQPNNIRQYLAHEAGELTNHCLDGIETLSDWQAMRPKKYQEMLEMLSLTDVPLDGERPPLNVTVTGEIQKDGYKIVKLYYESLPKLYVPANLYIPDNLTGPAPAVLYVCGHARTQKVYYQAHPRKWAQLGFVCLIIETIQWGEVQGSHWGCYAEGRFQWYSRGYTPGGVETWNSIRGLDLLCSRPEVDKEKLGVTGISGGGAYTWYTAAVDPRIKVAAPVCGNGTLEGHVHQRTLDGHCDCMMPINTYGIDFPNLAALIAPRPLLVAAANGDGLYSIESICHAFEISRKVYDLHGAGDRIRLVETPGGHSYHETSRTAIFSFFMTHLMNKDIPPEQAGDLEDSPESMLSEDELRVYVDGSPSDDRTTTIQDSFQKMAEPPRLRSENEWNRYKRDVVDFLRKKTFGAFPKQKSDLALRLEFRDSEEPFGNHTYSFVPEEGFRLKMECQWRSDPAEKHPMVLVLRSPDEKRWSSEGFASDLPSEWSRSFVETRGMGEFGWSPELQWHVRRAAAWTGRTVASMRVYDVLRSLEALRTLDGVDPDRIALAARGEMAAVALYAALLDGKVHTVLVENPPATQNQDSEKDGRGPAIEMLNCLRVTDVPQVAGLLYPTEVRLLGQPPETYKWAVDTAQALNRPESVRLLNEMGQWKPAR